MVNPKIAQARLREKAIQEGDGFGYPVSATEFDEAYEIYLGKVIRDFPGDSEDDRNLRAVRSVGIYLWRKMTLEQLLPDLFLEGLSTIAEETPASTSPEAARLESEAAESLRRATAAREEAEKASIAKTPAQHPQAPQATTMVAGMPLYGWLALKKEDPETAKMLMEAWQAEQTEKKARDLELERRMTDKEKNQSNWGPDGSYSQALTRPGADVKKNENEKKDKEKKDESRPNTNERRKPEAPLTLPRDAEGNPCFYVVAAKWAHEISRNLVGPNGEWVHAIENYFGVQVVKHFRKIGYTRDSPLVLLVIPQTKKIYKKYEDIPENDILRLKAATQFFLYWLQEDNHPEAAEKGCVKTFLDNSIRDWELIDESHGPLKQFHRSGPLKDVVNSKNYAGNMFKNANRMGWDIFNETKKLPAFTPRTDEQRKQEKERAESARQVGQVLGNPADESEIARNDISLQTLRDLNGVEEAEILDPNGEFAKEEPKIHRKYLAIKTARDALIAKRKKITSVSKKGVYEFNADELANPFSALSIQRTQDEKVETSEESKTQTQNGGEERKVEDEVVDNTATDSPFSR